MLQHLSHGFEETLSSDVSFLDVNYFIFSPSRFTSERLNNYKFLDVYKFFQDGWIRQILDKKIKVNITSTLDVLFTTLCLVLLMPME